MNRVGINLPLIVTIVRTEHEISELQDLAKRVTMNCPIWATIFAGTGNDDHICDFCHNPSGSMFQLKYNAEFIVICCINSKLDEWWSGNGNTTKVLSIGGLVNGTMQWERNSSIFRRKRETTHKELSAVAFNYSTGFEIHDGRYSGFFGEVLIELMSLMNFTIPSPTIMNAAGSWDTEKSKWTGVIGRVQEGKADLGIGFFTLTNHRLNAVDFTVPLITARSRLYMRKPEFAETVQWNTYFQAFKKEIWATILAMLFTAMLLLTLIKYNPQRNRFWPVVGENSVHVWGIFCQQGISEFPFLSSLRITYFSVFSMALIIFTAYSASLISVLTAPHMNLPFHNLEEFSQQTDYKLIVLRGSAEYDLLSDIHNSLETRIFKLMLPKESLPQTPKEVFDQICKKKVVYYGSTLLPSRDVNSPCELTYIASNMIENYAMILQKNSQYTELMDHHILRLQNNGILERLKQKYFSRSKSPRRIRDMVDLWAITPIFAILVGGILLSFLILFFEKRKTALFYHKFSRNSSSTIENSTHESLFSSGWKIRRKIARSRRRKVISFSVDC